ncbi:MAG: cupredoxin domain-containing protein [Candidatus Undinarchaeales archaeon]|nr:cupredoxin domain-containing protein [Candidatus Undinarchaeales archaeon]
MMIRVLALALLVGLLIAPFVVAEERYIEVSGKTFSYTPGVIKVNEGDVVTIRLTSEDVHHGLFLDGYEVQTKAHPGQDGVITFVADKPGRFTFRCSVTCGEFHPYMVGHLYVEPNSPFNGYAALAVLVALGSLIVMAREGNGDKPAKDKLFGLIDLDWRFDLTSFKPIRTLFKSRWFPLGAILVNLLFFFALLLSMFVGGYSAGNYNVGVMFVWILWWVMLMFILVPFFARTWCMVCPFPLFSDWYHRGAVIEVKPGKQSGLNKPWPKSLKNMWVMNFLFLGTTFFSGFMTVKPLASFILLGAVILASFIVGLVYKKRSFCLYMCPVSGFQALYSQFAMSEIRCKDPEICKGHTPKTCFVGSEEGHGCPWLLTPFDFKKNTYCGMCLECFKTCPHDNMAFNLRPPGVDLLVETKREKRGLDEAWKGFIMLGIAVVFFIIYQGPYGELKDMMRATTYSGFLTFIAIHSTVSLIALPAVFGVFAYLSKLASGNREVSLKRVFVNFSYTLVPMGLGVWIAFSLGILLPNGSYLLHVISDPFAWGWNLLGTANFPWTPVFTDVMGYLQGAVLIVFQLFCIAFGYRLSKQTYPEPGEAQRGWLPMLCFLTLATLGFLKLFLG